ncbi:hypothetical protein F4677DRAFT_256088 [Hypoxylon crocopeplum]|nr:hypothetical protein F4677DRAFT_256088 [Hypoxylon crocopeplum]
MTAKKLLFAPPARPTASTGNIKQEDDLVGSHTDACRGRTSEPVSNANERTNRNRDRSRSPAARETKRDTESYYQSRRKERMTERIGSAFRGAPKGTNLGLFAYADEGKFVAYKKDHFTGLVRPRRMMDDLYDKMTDEKLEQHRQLFRADNDESDEADYDPDNDEDEDADDDDDDDREEEEENDEKSDPDVKVESDEDMIKVESP